jgi:universal stress protein E
MLPFRKILVGFQSEERDKPALELAFRLAERSGGSVTIAHVLPPLPKNLPAEAGSLEDLTGILTHGAKDRVARVLESLPAVNVPISTRILSGPSALELVREVLRNGHQLLVKSSGETDPISGQFLGSVDMRLIRKCPCPVWVVKAEGHKRLGSVLAAVDPVTSDVGEEALNHSIIKMGLTLADMDEADLHVLHAWETWAENRLRRGMLADAFGAYTLALKSQAEKAMARFLKPYKKVIPRRHRHLVQGEPQQVVPDFVRGNRIDLVVMGTVARPGVQGFQIGNTAEMILGRVGCSILAVKPEGFVSSVDLDQSESA